MKRASVAWVLVVLSWASSASADDLARLSVTPWDALDGEARPYRYVVELRADRPIEAVVDRRLIELEVRPNGSRRRLRCRHPRAPRSAASARSRALAAGEVWREWIDLRMYCSGSALRALDAGAEVAPRYGWRRATTRLWVARAEGTSVREWTGGMTPEPFVFPPVEAPPVTVRLGAEAGPSAIDLTLAPTSASSAGALSLSVSVRAREGSERVYLRPESFSFRVRGPDGDFSCRMAPWGGAPVPDLYRRITPRVAWYERLEARVICPAGSFASPGLYEVVPKVRLDHDGAEWHLDAVTGRFMGPPAAVRILGGAYVEQAIPEPGGPGE
ncbi:MAG: hypothetical protein H6719_02970 [Sandaracinaceae bacterium]|nr:hypothetical protein [Sandaracinaceae bacterium]